jgi:hypothetical protein
LFESFGGLFKCRRSVSLASIDQSSKIDMTFRQAMLPVFSLDPYTTHGTLIPAGHIHCFSNVARGTCLRREKHQDNLGSLHSFAQGDACIPVSLPAKLAAAPEYDPLLVQRRFEVRDDWLFRIFVG